MLAAFLIYFREGVEAALLVGALLAGVRRLGRADAVRYVHVGLAGRAARRRPHLVAGQPRARGQRAADRELIGSGDRAPGGGGAVLDELLDDLQGRVAALDGLPAQGLEESLTRRNLALLAGLSFLAVYREAAETVLFTQALLLELPARGRPRSGRARRPASPRWSRWPCS